MALKTTQQNATIKTDENGNQILQTNADTIVNIFQQRHYFPKENEDYAIIFLKHWKEICKTEMTKNAYQIVMYLLSNLVNSGEPIHTTQRELCEYLNLKKQNVSKALKELETYTIIKRNERKIYFNPDYAYKGKVKEYGEIKSDFKQLKLF